MNRSPCRSVISERTYVGKSGVNDQWTTERCICRPKTSTRLESETQERITFNKVWRFFVSRQALWMASCRSAAVALLLIGGTLVVLVTLQMASTAVLQEAGFVASRPSAEEEGAAGTTGTSFASRRWLTALGCCFSHRGEEYRSGHPSCPRPTLCRPPGTP